MRKHGSKDLVTIMRAQERSPTVERSVRSDAAERQNLGETYPRGTVDGKAGRMSVEHHFDAPNSYVLQKALEHNVEETIFWSTLEEHYEVHSLNPKILNSRVFVYHPQIDAMTLDIDSTLKYCQVESTDSNLAFYRMILGEEMGLRKNAELVRTAGRVFEKEKPRKAVGKDAEEYSEIVDIVHKTRNYIWQLRTKS